jgi:hypothetical protein
MALDETKFDWSAFAEFVATTILGEPSVEAPRPPDAVRFGHCDSIKALCYAFRKFVTRREYAFASEGRA